MNCRAGRTRGGGLRGSPSRHNRATTTTTVNKENFSNKICSLVIGNGFLVMVLIAVIHLRNVRSLKETTAYTK